MSSGESIDIHANRVDEIACGQCGHVIDVSTLPVFSSLNCPKCQSKLTVPALLGNFLLLEQLGTGGMGAVYRGLDQSLGRFVAIKVMKKSLGTDAKLMESFMREARAAAALNHPNIVQIYSCGEESGQPYIAMELVSGARLDQMMAEGKIVKEARLLEIALDVSEGLKAANGLGLVHGDIKPANILMDKKGTAKVVDFGLAQFVNRQQQRGEIWGTPFYISPERARGALADHRSDIYSLGATLFHALTGKPPFDGKTATDVVLARLKSPAPDICSFNPSLQPETSAVIGRMLEADTMRRYPTSASLQADLRAALNAAREAERHGGFRPSLVKKSAAPKIAAFVLIGLAAVAGLIWLIASAKKASVPPPPPVVVGPQAGPQSPGETFFDADAEQKIIAAAFDLSSGQTTRMMMKIDKLYEEVPKNSARAAWLRIIKVIPLWVDGRESDAAVLMGSVSSIKVSQPENHPAQMPPLLARYLTDEIDEDEFRARTKAWPVWYMELANFFAGLQECSMGDSLRGTLHLQSFANSANTLPAWAYSFRASAKKWVEATTQWEDVKRQANKMIVQGKPKDARDLIDKFLPQAPPFLKAQVYAESERASVAAGEKVARTPVQQVGAVAAPGEVQAGTWSTEDLKTSAPPEKTIDVTSYISSGGTHAIRFQQTFGATKLEIDWVALVVNGAEAARDTHAGSVTKTESNDNVYTVNAPAPTPGATYQLKIKMHAAGRKSSRGTIFIKGP